MSDLITTFYYSVHDEGGSFGILPSPINSAAEKEMADADSLQTIVTTWGDLKIVVYVDEDEIP